LPSTGRWARGVPACALALAAFTATVLAVPAPAEAHPFGDPQTVAIALDADRPQVVHVRWKVGGTDDLTLLGVSLGLLPKDRVLLDGAVFYRDSDAAAIGPSDPFAAYLTKQITVASTGRSCDGTVERPSDLAKTGVIVDYTCPGPVATATVGVRMLTDLNPAYQTLATGPDGQRAVYGSGQYSHDWSLGDTPAAGHSGLGASAALQLGLVVGSVLLVAGAVTVLWRRRRRAVA
jgi:hypothetical protein